MVPVECHMNERVLSVTWVTSCVGTPTLRTSPDGFNWRNIASLTMSAVSSTFRAHYSMHAEQCAISLSLNLCQSNQGSLAISVQVWNSVRPMHLFGRNLDHDY